MVGDLAVSERRPRAVTHIAYEVEQVLAELVDQVLRTQLVGTSADDPTLTQTARRIVEMVLAQERP